VTGIILRVRSHELGTTFYPGTMSCLAWGKIFCVYMSRDKYSKICEIYWVQF
jgi:hypothetical protein